ncbi:MAG: NUDIX domain-containing protein [Bacteroidales bacterium]|nr:NUDIX domain-containing protein [Bacteroidales bacterium]
MIINVAAAIIRLGDKIFATQRGYGEWKDWWEFPGGKIEEGESPEQALVREIREELDAGIHIDRFLHKVEWDYPKFHLTMHCFMCSLVGESIHLNEHESARWLDYAALHDVRWLPADEGLLPLISAELLGVEPSLASYIESEVIPRYAAFDKAHQEDHARSVVSRSCEMAAFYDVDRNILYAAAACHDLGLAIDRKTHHLESGKAIRSDKDLSRWFSGPEIEIIAQAAEDHRASSGKEPRSIYGKIVAEADRLIIPEVVIRRTVQFGLDHYPGLSRRDSWERTLSHLKEKYGEGGYLSLWIPESPNAPKLHELQAMIKDEKSLRVTFNRIWREEVLGPLVCDRFKEEEHYRKGHIAIIAAAPGTDILGLHTPEIKAVAKTISRRNDVREIISDWEEDKFLSHDERLIWGLTLDYMKCSVDERLSFIRRFIPRIDNWAICDTFCCNSKWIKADEARSLILECIAKGQPEFTRRVGVILLLSHYLGPEWIERTFSDIDSMSLEEGEPYYVRMGVAWVLATALAKDARKTRSYLSHADLPQDILRLYVRKARESRITRDLNPLSGRLVPLSESV